jgi:hypothetical protein
MCITLQNKDDYRNMASFNSTMKLYTALETAEHVYTEYAAKHWTEQSVKWKTTSKKIKNGRQPKKN